MGQDPWDFNRQDEWMRNRDHEDRNTLRAAVASLTVLAVALLILAATAGDAYGATRFGEAVTPQVKGATGVSHG